MKTNLILAAIAVCLTSCVSVPEGGYQSLPSNRDYHASFDRVWGAVVSIASEKGSIKNIDKASGLLTTEPFAVGGGFTTEIALKKYASQPASFLATWSEGQGSLTFFVSRHGDVTNVRITGRFAGFENNVTHSWHAWPTKGILENSVLDQISQMVGGR
jgi:hypothetical protein